MGGEVHLKTIIVTGGAGFIGSNFIHIVLHGRAFKIVNLDKLTYAGNLDSVYGVEANSRYKFIQGDICDATLVKRLLAEYQPQAIAHFAAESHVDRSIDEPEKFITTNTGLPTTSVNQRSESGLLVGSPNPSPSR